MSGPVIVGNNGFRHRYYVEAIKTLNFDGWILSDKRAGVFLPGIFKSLALAEEKARRLNEWDRERTHEKR